MLTIDSCQSSFLPLKELKKISLHKKHFSRPFTFPTWNIFQLEVTKIRKKKFNVLLVFIFKKGGEKCYRPSVNPTLYFIFLQWGSHSFIRIPKVDIIFSKCFQRQSAASTYILSRVGRKLWNLLNTNRGVTDKEGWWRRADERKWEGKMRRKERREKKDKKIVKEYTDDLFVYIATVMTPWTVLERLYLLPVAYFYWQGSSQFLAWYYVAEYDWEVDHKIIYLLQVYQCDFCREAQHINPCVLHVCFVWLRSLLNYSLVIVQV